MWFPALFPSRIQSKCVIFFIFIEGTYFPWVSEHVGRRVSISTFASLLRKEVCVTSEMEHPQTWQFTVLIAAQTTFIVTSRKTCIITEWWYINQYQVLIISYHRSSCFIGINLRSGVPVVRKITPLSTTYPFFFSRRKMKVFFIIRAGYLHTHLKFSTSNIA